ncbi:MAG: PqqD family protein [Gemmatimonadota bacterium]
MKPRTDVLTARLADEAVLLDLESKDYFRLNETGAAIWDGLERGLTPDVIEGELCDTFEVDPAEAAARVGEFLAELSRRGLIVE